MRIFVIVMVCALALATSAAWGTEKIATMDNWTGDDPAGSAYTLWEDPSLRSETWLDGDYSLDWNRETAGSYDGYTVSLLSGEHGRGGMANWSNPGQLSGLFSLTEGFTMGAHAKINVANDSAFAELLYPDMDFGYMEIGVAFAVHTDTGTGTTTLGIMNNNRSWLREEAAPSGTIGSWHNFTMSLLQIGGSGEGSQLLIDLWIDGIQQYADWQAMDDTFHFYVVDWDGAYDGYYPWYNNGGIWSDGGWNDLIFAASFETNEDDFDTVWDNVGIISGIVDGYCPGAPVPEPSSLLALATGFIGLAGVVIRRKR